MSDSNSAQSTGLRDDEDCPVCHKLDLPVEREDLSGKLYKAIKTTVSKWKDIVEEGHCTFCIAMWRAFEAFPPPNGWPPAATHVQLNCRYPSRGCYQIGLADEGKEEDWGLYVAKIRHIQERPSIEIWDAVVLRRLTRPIEDQPLGDEPLDNEPLDDKPLDYGPLDNEPPHDEPLDDKPLDDGPLDDGRLDDGPLDDGRLDDGRLDDELRGSKSVKDVLPVWRTVSANSGDMDALTFITKCFNRCKNKHKTCRSPGLGPCPKRLLHIGENSSDRVYLELGSDVDEPYATLSYCWGGGSAGVKTTKENLSLHFQDGIAISDLPPTIRNAITVLRHLHIEFVWIDRLCIIQDDTKDWVTEAGRMCEVYSNATLCISADRAASVWDGLFDTNLYAEEFRRDEIKFTHNNFSLLLRPYREHSSLDSYFEEQNIPTARRGWTFQEQQMSPRLVHFTPNELVWKCKELIKCECGREDVSNPPNPLTLEGRNSVIEIYNTWKRYVENFSTRALTVQTDKLYAFSGIATQFAHKLNEIDAASEYVAGLWKEDIVDQLCWEPAGSEGHAAWRRNNQTSEGREAWRRDNQTSVSSPLVDMMTKVAEQCGFVAPKPTQIRRANHYIGPSWSWASLDGPIRYFFGWPLTPVQSAVNVESYRIIELNESGGNEILERNGTRTSLTMSGSVVSDLVVETSGFSTADRFEFVFEVKDHYGNVCRFVPDDPEETFSAAQASNLKCLHIGTRTIAYDPLYRVRLVKLAPDDGETIWSSEQSTHKMPLKIACSENSPTAVESHSASDLDIHTEEAESSGTVANQAGFRDTARVETSPSTVSTVPAKPAKHPDNSDVYNFYLLLVPTNDSGTVCRRIACLYTGMNSGKIRVMEKMFEHSMQETLTLI